MEFYHCHLPSRRFATSGVLILYLALAACVSVGPTTIQRDQFDYGMAIADSQREQILSNIVGLRYVEAPLFVNVASVINQYALEGEMTVGGGLNTSILDGNTMTMGGAGRWSDRPTITYAPVSGRKFAASLLTPLPPESLFALVQAGWSPELILRMTVHSINGVENELAAPTLRRQMDPRFTDLIEVWGRLRHAGVLGLRREDENGESAIIVYLTEGENAVGLQDDVSLFRKVLGLAPGTTEARLRYGLVSTGPNEISVLTSSILELMNELAWRVDVPPGHVEEGRTISTFASDDTDSPPLIRIYHAETLPEHALVAVNNRGYWFYIDDRDVVSKRTFAMVQILLSLTDSGDAARGPVIALPN